jgi:hypothetical protein
MKILVSVLSGVIGILAALLVSGCASVQPQPGPWVYQEGTWCQANTPDCKTPVKTAPWYNLGLSDETWAAVNDTVVIINGTTTPRSH